MQLFEEEFLEPFARYVRFHSAINSIEKNIPVIVADLGCGPKIRFYKYALKNDIKFMDYFGIDPLIDSSVISNYASSEEISLIKDPMKKKIPLKDMSVDYVVGFAFLEHIDFPGRIVNEAVRVLKPGGKAIFTTPSHRAKGVLEFLSFKLGLISRREIEEHKNYFNKSDLMSLIAKDSRNKVHAQHSYFECGLNNLFILEKK